MTTAGSKRTKDNQQSGSDDEGNRGRKRVRFGENVEHTDEQAAAEVAPASDSDSDAGIDKIRDLEEEDTGEVGFEPFNLNEEREQGSFDESGFYVFNDSERKQRKNMRGFGGEDDDAWMDDVEQKYKSEIEREERKRRQSQYKNKKGKGKGPAREVDDGSSDEEEDSSEDEMSPESILDLKESLVLLMKDGEDVMQTIRRCGNKKSDDYDKERMEKVTSLASDLMSAGVFGIYNEKYSKLVAEVMAGRPNSKIGGATSDDTIALNDREKLKEMLVTVEELSKIIPSTKATAKEAIKRAQFLRMDISDLLDDGNLPQKETASASRAVKELRALESKWDGFASKSGETNDTMWEYKVEGAEGVHGPYSSSQMRAWKEQGYFSGDTKALARQVPSSSSSAVVDEDMDMFGDQPVDAPADFADASTIEF